MPPKEQSMKSRYTGLVIILLLALILPAAGCNKAADSGGTNGSANSVAESPSVVTKTPPARETAGGNTPITPPPAVEAPDFTYTAFDGSSGKLSGLTGKPTVVNLWAVW